jgi:hypothetical protein
VTTNGQITGTAGSLYYAGSPYTSIRPGAYTGTGLVSHSTAAFESGPSASYPTRNNVNFPTGTGGENYFTEPNYTAASKTFSPTFVAAPGPAMERNSFTGPSYQGINLSLAKGFNIPPARVIGEHAALEFRVDAFNLLNFQEVTSPTTSITSTTFGQSGGALAARIIELQGRFSF